jgi:hypothetical protein
MSTEVPRRIHLGDVVEGSDGELAERGTAARD